MNRKDKAQLFRERNKREGDTVEWQKKQDSIRSRDKYACQHCKKVTGIRLDVHHRYYVDDGRKYWEYPDKAFISLCRECHEREEDALFDAGYELRRAIGWRNGEAKEMMLLAKALDKAKANHSISDIIAAIDELVDRDDILDELVEIIRKRNS